MRAYMSRRSHKFKSPFENDLVVPRVVSSDVLRAAPTNWADPVTVSTAASSTVQEGLAVCLLRLVLKLVKKRKQTK